MNRMNKEKHDAHAKAFNERAAKVLGNLPEDFDNLTGEEQQQLCDWINENFSKIKTMNRRYSTYYYKHIFEQYGFYITNGQFKGALLKCGFKTAPIREGINWYANISARDVTRLTKGKLIA